MNKSEEPPLSPEIFQTLPQEAQEYLPALQPYCQVKQAIKSKL